MRSEIILASEVSRDGVGGFYFPPFHRCATGGVGVRKQASALPRILFVQAGSEIVPPNRPRRYEQEGSW